MIIVSHIVTQREIPNALHLLKRIEVNHKKEADKMESSNARLAEQIAEEVETTYVNLNIDQKWQLAIDEWFAAEQRLGETRPSRTDVERFLKKIVSDVLRQITVRESRLTRATLLFIINQYMIYLINDLHFQDLTPYRIPIGILAAIVVETIVENVSSSLKSSGDDPSAKG